MSILYSGSIGLNNKVPVHRLPYDRETGVAGLEDAVDVMIDRTGEIVTRSGSELLQSGSFHSMWPTAGGFYIAEDRDSANDCAIHKGTINADGSVDLTGVWSGLAHGQRWSYADLDGVTLCCNGYQNGSLKDATADYWPTSVWPDDETTSDKIAAPVGKHIATIPGRVLIAVDDEVFFTEYGLPGLIDAVDNRRRFEGKIIMLASVQTGFYVSTESAIYFVSTTDPDPIRWASKQVTKYPAMEYGVNPDLVDPSFLGLETTQLSALFATVKGPAIGLPDGTVVNLVDKNLTMPDCGSINGSVMVVDETMIIQSGG